MALDFISIPYQESGDVWIAVDKITLIKVYDDGDDENQRISVWCDHDDVRNPTELDYADDEERVAILRALGVAVKD